MLWKLMFATVVVAGVGGGLYLTMIPGSPIKAALKSLSHTTPAASESQSSSAAPDVKSANLPEWDGRVSVNRKMQRAFGLHIAAVAAQTEPLKLELAGRTAYDPDTLFKVRPRFDTLVLKVYVTRGKQVKKGESLVDLYSTDLASAKSLISRSKFVRVAARPEASMTSAKSSSPPGAISEQLWVDTQNDEQKSHLNYLLALDKLQVYEVPEEDIAPLIAGLKDKGKEIDVTQFGDVSQKAKMTLLRQDRRHRHRARGRSRQLLRNRR